MNNIDLLLNQQLQELDNLAQLLDDEYSALQQRQHEKLSDITQQKAIALQRLSSNDGKLAKVAAQLTEENKQHISSLKQQVEKLEHQNLKNGKLLALMSASHNRLRNIMLPPERRAGTTYTKLGQKQHAGKGNCHYAV